MVEPWRRCSSRWTTAAGRWCSMAEPIVGANVVIYEGTVIGEGVRIGDNAVVGKRPALSRSSAARRDPLARSCSVTASRSRPAPRLGRRHARRRLVVGGLGLDLRARGRSARGSVVGRRVCVDGTVIGARAGSSRTPTSPRTTSSRTTCSSRPASSPRTTTSSAAPEARLALMRAPRCAAAPGSAAAYAAPRYRDRRGRVHRAGAVVLHGVPAPAVLVGDSSALPARLPAERLLSWLLRVVQSPVEAATRC